jgi:cytochrome c oxidase subunit II
MAVGPTAATPAAAGGANHGRNVVVAWLVLSVIATPLVAIFLGPEIPPGNGSAQGTEQVFDNQVMTTLITPVVCLLAVFFVYGLRNFRAAKGGALVDGPPLRNDSRIQVLWVAITSAMVLSLAGFGTYELLQTGAGGGQGPSPIAYPANHQNAFEIQVIAQQWQFTYRYPSLGGLETNQLVLPADTDVVLHVTSLDAVHSFWAIELGVKADANPGVDNVAYVETKGARTFHVRCAELCGLWHGYMFNNGRVLAQADFQSWAKTAKAVYAPISQYMPKYAHVYLPDPQRRAG